MKNYTSLLLTLILFISSNILAQEVKFGKVSKKELEEKFYPQDTSANAVVLYKKQRTFYEYSGSEGWALKTEIHERIKLYNKDGFESATKKIQYYTQGSDEKITIKAYTYNLEGGKIEKTKLEKSGIFREEMSENWSSKNFTMPNLKDGSIVEWKYIKTSEYYTYIDDVLCQYSIPIKYLDVEVKIPEFFVFKHLPSRYYPMKVNLSKTTKNITFTYRTPERSGKGGTSAKTNLNRGEETINENIYMTKLSNVPALKLEPYVNNINNYRAKIKFEISAYRPTNGIPKYYNTTWQDVTKTIYESPNFGIQLNKSSHFKNDLENILAGVDSENEKVSSIFEFVKSKIKWNELNQLYVSSNGIKDAYKKGVGNSSEVNLTLVAMLREAGIKANPVLVSTRSHGIPLFPTKKGYNYVIAGIEIQNKVILMDATDIYSSPNVLPERVLNWEGRLIRKNGTSVTIDLYPKKYNTKNALVSVKLDTEGSISGFIKTNYTNLNALRYRHNYNSYSENDLLSELETAYSGIEIEKIRLSHKNDLSKPIVEMIKFSSENQADIIGDKIYISPLLFLTQQENPFKLKERLYPIDYGSPWKNDIRVTIQIPQGFTVSSKPEDMALELPDNLGTYILKTTVTNNQINVIAQTKINTPLIGAIHYKVLKELYKQAIEKQKEKIVLVSAHP